VFLGGGGPLACGVDTYPGVVLANYFIPDPPPPLLVKLQMARGGLEFFMTVDLSLCGM
jgi:hypothetical protein